jgi:hypothetical protein
MTNAHNPFAAHALPALHNTIRGGGGAALAAVAHDLDESARAGQEAEDSLGVD